MMTVANTELIARNDAFANNHATGDAAKGGALAVSGSGRISNSTIADNVSDWRGRRNLEQRRFDAVERHSCQEQRTGIRDGWTGQRAWLRCADMPDDVLTRDRILEAAEDVLRRYGPAKATVVDVAYVLGVSHGSVYRHFSSKQALRDAVVERWLARISAPLDAVVLEKGAALERLRRWLDLLISAKWSRALDDPQLFATYMALVADAREVVRQHVDHLTAQLAEIIADGVARGEFAVTDPSAGRAVFNATARFHNPAHAAEWSDPSIDAALEDVWSLVARGLGASTSGATRKRRN